MPLIPRPRHLAREEQHSFLTWYAGSQTIQKVLGVARLPQQLLFLRLDRITNAPPTPSRRDEATQGWLHFRL